MCTVITDLKDLNVGDLVFVNVAVHVADIADIHSKSATTIKMKKGKPVKRICIVLEPGTTSIQVTYVATFGESALLPTTLDKTMWHPFIPASKEGNLEPLPPLKNNKAQWASLRAKHTISASPVPRFLESVPVTTVNIIKERIKAWFGAFGSIERASNLAEQQNVFSSRVTGIPIGDPKQLFAIINFANGHYLALSADKTSVISLFLETAQSTSTIQEACQWIISRGDQETYTLSHKTIPTSFALTKSQGTEVDDPVTYGTETQGNALYTLKEATTGDRGRYIISPKSSTSLAAAIKAFNDGVPPTSSAETPVLLASKDESNNFGLWVLLPAGSRTNLDGESSSRAPVHVRAEDGTGSKIDVGTTGSQIDGNRIETLEQMSIFSRATGTFAGDPKHAFYITNFATGYYLTLSTDKNSIASLPPNTTKSTSSMQQTYQWIISKRGEGSYTLSNKTVSTNFALTKSQDAEVNDPVAYGGETQGNTLFEIKEVVTGVYAISPKPDTTLAVAMKAPYGDASLPQLVTVLLAPKDESNKFGLWVLTAVQSETDLQGESGRVSIHVRIEGPGTGPNV